MLPAAPGDVLAVAGSNWLVRSAIELAEDLSGEPYPASHVCVITHQDRLGRWVAIQGEPGGVGIVDATGYLKAPVTRSNHDQPKAPPGSPEMNGFLASCAKSLGLHYDWAGIAEDGLDALHLRDLAADIDHLWRWPAGHGRLPAEVVCSSLAAELYRLAGWAHPDVSSERTCLPSDWWRWNAERQWLTAA